MIKQIENYLNCRQYLRDNIPVFMEYFIRYYGEDKRKEIEEKFSNVIYLAYRNPKTVEMLLSKLSEEISDEIIDKYLKDSKTMFTKKELFEYDFQYESIQPINKYQSFCELYQLGREGRLKQFKQDAFDILKSLIPILTEEEYEEMMRTQTILPKYTGLHEMITEKILYYINPQNAEYHIIRYFIECEEILHQIDPNITTENFGEYQENEQIQALNKLVEQKKAMLEEYHMRMSAYEKYRKEVEEDKKVYSDLEAKAYTQLIEENIDLLTPEDIEVFEEYKKNPGTTMLSKHIYSVFGYSITSNQDINAFSQEADEIIKEGTSNWRIECIRRDRINYFKNMGINLGEEYEAYASSEVAKRVWPSCERVARFKESRDRILNEFNIAYYSSRPDHQAAREEIRRRHFLDKEDAFDARLYTSSNACTFLNPNLVRTKDGYRLYSLIALNCDHITEYKDHDFIHELNHLYELFLLSVKGNYYEGLCGWDALGSPINQDSTQTVNTLKTDREKRKYEWFNEIVNELIAQEISDMMIKDHKHVFDSDESAVNKHTTSYENAFFIARDFFQEFKEDIIKSRSNGNIQIIWDKVGKENFDALNELIVTFFEHFDGFKYVGLLQSLQEGENTAATRIYYDIINKRDEILDRMRKYSMVHAKNAETTKKSQGVKL